MILNIIPGVFGGPLRAGDLIGVANVVEHLRKERNDPELKFYMHPDAINKQEYCQLFYSFMMHHTDYFSRETGKEFLNWKNVNLFDYRDRSGDLVKIKHSYQMKDKIVVCPLFDAPYNVYRNWPISVFESITEKYSQSPWFNNTQKIICSKEPISVKGWENSTDYHDNLMHIMDCRIFVGGDTATSHLAGIIDPLPLEIEYYYSSRSLVHALPFGFLENHRKGYAKLNTYWLDFERTTWG